MKRILQLCIVLTIVLFVSGCTNDKIKEAIDDCKGDPECYEIIDNAITEELEARGIQGGTMTVGEMEAVIDFLSEYKMDGTVYAPDIQFDQMYNFDYESILGYQLFTTEFDQILENQEYFDLRNINPEGIQYFIQDGTRFIIYKSGRGRFIYEINADEKYVMEIDLELEKLYFNSMLVPNFKELQDTIFSDEELISKNYLMHSNTTYCHYQSNTQNHNISLIDDETVQYYKLSNLFLNCVDTDDNSRLQIYIQSHEGGPRAEISYLTNTDGYIINVPIGEFYGNLSDLSNHIEDTSDDWLVIIEYLQTLTDLNVEFTIYDSEVPYTTEYLTADEVIERYPDQVEIRETLYTYDHGSNIERIYIYNEFEIKFENEIYYSSGDLEWFHSESNYLEQYCSEQRGYTANGVVIDKNKECGSMLDNSHDSEHFIYFSDGSIQEYHYAKFYEGYDEQIYARYDIDGNTIDYRHIIFDNHQEYEYNEAGELISDMPTID